jgi:hypothetical protein
MAARTRHAPLSDRGALWNLALVWVINIAGLLTAIGCVGYILNESLISYATCGTRSETCGDAGWYSSMGLTFFGGFAVVIIGGALGIRRRHRGTAAWYPVAGLGGVLLLTAVAVVLLKTLTRT